MIFLPDGMGKRNEEGLSYYNSLIDVLLDKGLLFSIFQCLFDANFCLLPSFYDCPSLMFLHLCIRYTTISNTLLLGPSPGTGRQIWWLVKLSNWVWKTTEWSYFKWSCCYTMYVAYFFYFTENWFHWSWGLICTCRILFTMPLLASRNSETEWSTGSLLMSPIALQFMVMTMVSKHLGGVPLCPVCSTRTVAHQLNHILYLLLAHSGAFYTYKQHFKVIHGRHILK